VGGLDPDHLELRFVSGLHLLTEDSDGS